VALRRCYVLEIYTFPNYSESKTDTVVRKTLPKPERLRKRNFQNSSARFCPMDWKWFLAERKSVTGCHSIYYFDAGYAADQFASPGTANLAMNMMDEGTTTRNALQTARLAMLGANLGTGSNLDCPLFLFLRSKQTWMRRLLSMQMSCWNRLSRRKILTACRNRTIASIQREKTQPVQMGLRVLPKIIIRNWSRV